MKHSFVTRKWKQIVSAGLSLAMTASLFSAVPVSASPLEEGKSEKTTDIVPVKDKTPVTDKAGSISMSQLENNETQKDPFPEGTAGSHIFRIPAIHAMKNGELIAIADIRYDQMVDGNGLDTIASISSDGGKTWEYGFPIYLPDSYRASHKQSTASLDPGFLEGPDGTLYCIADVYPTEYSFQNISPLRLGNGYVEIDGEQRLALTKDYTKVGEAPVNTNDANYLYYVAEFEDGYAQILKREDQTPSGYAVDEWYNLYSVAEDGTYVADLKQPQINNTDHQVQQNVYYKDSLFHVYQTGYLWMVTSKDHGRTWEHPRDIISQVRKADERSLVISPGCGLTTKDGTLVIGCYYHGKGDDTGVEKASLLYSSDNGVTWQRTDDLAVESSENEVVELEDGTLRMFYRSWNGKISYADFTKNGNGGYDVGTPVETNISVASNTNMGAISYSKKINGKEAILISWPEGPGYDRKNGKLYTFLVNEDKTMELYHKLHVDGGEESFSYSNITELQDGSVGMLWEGNGYEVEIHYERYQPSDFAPGAFLGEDETGTLYTTIEKDDTYTKTYHAEDNSPVEVTTAPNKNVATATADKVAAYSIKVPVFNWVSENSDANEAFATATASAELLELTELEFTFNKIGDKYHIKNEKSGQFLTFNQTSGGGANYYTAEAGDVDVIVNSGKIRLHCNYATDNNTRYIILWPAWCRFDAQKTDDNADACYDFTLWEKDVENSSDSELPGYKKVTVSDAAELDGKSYLITMEHQDNIYLLYPENGGDKHTKLLAKRTEDNKDRVPEAVISGKYEVAVTITGVNEGSTKAVIDGKTYQIQVTDQIERKPIKEAIEMPLMGSYKVTEGSEHADVKEVDGDACALYDFNSAIANDINSFSNNNNEGISIADAEFTFTKDSDKSDHWFVQSGNLYLINSAGDDRLVFKTERGSMNVTQDSNSEKFKFLNDSNSSNIRHFIFYPGSMTFNAQGGDGGYGFTLWKKDATAPDSMIPGYRKVEQNTAIEEGGVYLITYVHTQDAKEYAILLYPQENVVPNDAGPITKLIRWDRRLQITPKSAGIFKITVDGKDYAYKFVDSDCAHGNGTTYIKGIVDADCENEGYTGDTVCADCDTVTEKGEAVPALSHDYQAEQQVQALTESQNGIYVSVCSRNNLHQKKRIVYASAYKRLKELFSASPEEISEANKGFYRAEDVTALETAYTDGKAVADKAAAQQTNEEMYSSMEAFESAKTKLHRYRNILEIQFSDSVAAAAPLYEKGNQGSYVEADWNAFAAAYEAARDAEIAKTTYTDLETMITTLKDTYAKIVFADNKGSLQKLYDTLKEKQKGDYSNSTWAIFTAALKNAETVLANEAATLKEIKAAEQTLQEAADGLKTVQEEEKEREIPVPGSIAYTAPAAGAYPKEASITADENDMKHTTAVSDWTEETATLVREDEALVPEFVKLDGRWGFNDQLKSNNSKYDVNGEKSMAITFKLWLKTIQNSGTVEILARGQQYSVQLKNGKLVLWMLYDGYPTEEFALSADEHTGKWLDVVLVINGKDKKQRLYVNGGASADNGGGGTVNLTSSSEPFTVGYRSGGDGLSFTNNIGYLADIKFYDCGTQDVTNGLTNDYEAIVNLLNAKTPEAIISADLYDAKTVWSSVKGEQSSVMEGTAKFEANTSYMATTTFKAHDVFRFPDTEEFRTAVQAKVSAGKDNAKTTVAVSEDRKTMTVEVSYPSDGIVEPAECTCSISKVNISGGTELVIPSKEEQGRLQLGASVSVDSSCQVEGHPGTNPVTYAYAIKEGAENNTAGASVQENTGLVTATQEGSVVIAVTATLASGTESGKSKTEEVTIKVTKAKDGEFVVSFDANAGNDTVEGMPKNATVTTGTAFAKPSETPKRTGYVFKGWSAAADGAVIADADWPQTINGDTKYFAIWEKENGGDVTQGEAEVAVAEAISAAESIYQFAQGNYTAESWAAFEAAYNAAKNPAEGISPAELKQLADNLANAQRQLVLDHTNVVDNVNKTLSAADAKFAEVNKGAKAYEASSWAAYQEAHDALQKAINENADDETLHELYQAFAKAESMLKEDTVWMDAKKALTKALSAAKPKYAKGAKAYTSATWKPFKTAYDNAYKQRNANAAKCSAKTLSDLTAKLNSTSKALKKAPVLKKGDSVVKSNVKYVVTDVKKKTVRAEGVKSKKNKKFSVNILTTVTIKGTKCNVTEVKEKAFYKFTKITKVTIGSKVTKIGKQAFEGCKAVTTLNVNGDVKTFDKQSFNGCSKLKKVVFKGKKVPAFKSKAFKGTASNMTVTLNKKMSKKNKAKMKNALLKAGVSKKAKIK